MKDKPFQIELLDIHWLEDTPEEIDLCAHGQVKVKVGEEVIVGRRENENHWTLSAMAMHLLRTLEKNHEENDLVGEHLIPCCGHHIDHFNDELDVHIPGCFTGVNYWVKHQNKEVKLETKKGNQVIIPIEEYKSEVLAFVDKVEDFYKRGKPKKLPDDDYDRNGYEKFWQEWKRRKQKLNE